MPPILQYTNLSFDDAIGILIGFNDYGWESVEAMNAASVIEVEHVINNFVHDFNT
jgi:hypothetical protein